MSGARSGTSVEYLFGTLHQQTASHHDRLTAFYESQRAWLSQELQRHKQQLCGAANPPSLADLNKYRAYVPSLLVVTASPLIRHRPCLHRSLPKTHQVKAGVSPLSDITSRYV
jgi:hypothetical protein